MFWYALSIGFLGNFHCIGMCGPIAMSLPIGRLSPLQKNLAILSYNLGRVTTYGLLGAIAGLLGASFNIFTSLQLISLIGGIILVLIGILTLFAKSNLGIKAGTKLVGKLKRKLGTLLTKNRIDSMFFLGLLNGLLPCGLVYTALVGSLIMGSWSGGAIYMALFGIGTLPFMVALPYVGQFISLKLRNTIRKIIPYSIIFFGVLFILRGANLGIPYLSPLKPESGNTEVNQQSIPSNTVICH